MPIILPKSVSPEKNISLHIEDKPLDLLLKSDIINTHLKQLTSRQKNFLGYQTNQNVEFPSELMDFLSINILNLGDGFEQGYYKINTKKFEQAIVSFYARIWNLSSSTTDSQEDDPHWGYVTPMGSTEGNIGGLWYAREYLLGNLTHSEQKSSTSNHLAVEPIIFFTESTHYSIVKACNMLRISLFSEVGPSLGNCPINNGEWPQRVPSNDDGSIHIPSLKILVQFFYERGYPVILSLNYGTTFSGAFDDVGAAVKCLKPVFEMNKNGYWIHVDGALAANYMPFIEKGMNQGEIPKNQVPSFDFRHKEVMSISASPYKWLGSPWPFGVLIMRQPFHIEMLTHANYVGNRDGTVCGSRSGLSAIFLWEKLSKLGKEGLVDMVKKNESLVQYVYSQLEQLDRSGKLLCSLLLQPLIPFSNIILFRLPSSSIVDQFTLCAEEWKIGTETYSLCHLVILEQVNKSTIDELIIALSAPDAFNVDN